MGRKERWRRLGVSDEDRLRGWVGGSLRGRRGVALLHCHHSTAAVEKRKEKKKRRKKKKKKRRSVELCIG